MAQPSNEVSIIATSDLSTDGFVSKVEPSSPVPTFGFTKQSLAYQHVNYLWNNHGEWINYITEEQIPFETAARVSADEILADDIEDEAALRAAADSALSTDIAQEATARSSADTNLSGLITSLTNLLKPTLVTSTSYSSNGDEPASVVTRSTLPNVITTNTRYVLTNPFGTNVRFRAEPEVYINSKWTPVIGGFAGDSDSTGLIAGYMRGEGLIIQTGNNALAQSNASLTLTLAGTGSGTVSSAPCRIWCYRDIT